MAEFKLPDPKKTSGKVLGIGLLGVLGLVTYSYILPFLNRVVWGTAELAVGVGVSAVLLYILLSPTFWRRTRIVLDTFGEILFRGFVEMNPFTILTLQIDKAEKDREKLAEQCKSLRAQENSLAVQVDENRADMAQSGQEIEICRKKLAANPNDEEAGLLLESSATTYANAKDFVDSVYPILADIRKLIEFADKAYRKSGNALKNAKNTIAVQKAKYEAVTTGSSAMKRALRAFTGDPEMNKAGAIALEKLRADIAQKVGTIKTSIQLTSQIMNERDLRDAAKVSLAAKTAEGIDVDKAFEYIPSLDSREVKAIPGTSRGNKYLDTLKN